MILISGMFSRPKTAVFFAKALLLLSFLSPAAAAAEMVELPPVLMQMLRNDPVFEQLKLTDAERERVTGVLDRVDGQWWRSRIMQDAERIDTVRRLTQEVKDELRQFLSPKAFSRLLQLERQALGTRMFLLDDVAADLTLSSITMDKMRAIAVEIDGKASEIQKRAQAGEHSEQVEAEKKELAKRELSAIVGLLSNENKARIKGLVGEPFDFSQVQRTYPRAPELVAAPEHWLQGSPISLAELRGNVVAVHFYAFQCINCQRNLPHYSRWHADYADQGLVVIGVQTPETSSEREPVRVAKAAEQERIEYPVLMDPESKNWQAWGTTMWPTVYLVDRQGYIRAWWPGEMNWQGKPGEQQMRTHIESLLNEPR